MPSGMTVTIKLKPYLQEYLISALNGNLEAGKKSIIGVLLRPFLEIPPIDFIPKRYSGSEYITFELPYYNDLNVKYNYHVTDGNQIMFEESLDVWFKEIFYQYMDDKYRYIKSYKKCILQFCSDHNITFTHITYEMLKKSYYRKLKDRQKEKAEKFKNKSKKLVTNCPSSVPDKMFVQARLFFLL